MQGFLTTHVLDTARGIPSRGIVVELYRDGQLLGRKTTNDDGRTDGPILAAEDFALGDYVLLFKAGDYLDGDGGRAGSTFLKDIPIHFTMDQDQHYHVPLLLSGYGYSTYRGS